MADPLLRNRTYLNKALIGLLLLSLLANVAIGALAWKTHQDQRVIAADLHTTMVRTKPLIGWSKQVDGGQSVWNHIYGIDRRLNEIEDWSASIYLIWLNRNHDQLNRILLLANRSDYDRDGVVDAKDECPTIAVNPMRVNHRHPGCPIEDRDDDNVPDIEDVCPDEAVVDGVWNWKDDGLFRTYQTYRESLALSRVPKDRIEAAFYGCPDTDGDGIADRIDACPDTKPQYDANLDGCEDPNYPLRPGEYTIIKPTPTYISDETGKIGVFLATHTVGGTFINFGLHCEALDAAGARLPVGAKAPMAAAWGNCYAGTLNLP